MTTIVTRAGKGSPLTNTEVDSNFTNLNTAKIETLTSTDTSVTITGTGSSRDLSVPVNPNVVSGPASATANAVPRFNSTTGKLIKNSGVTIDDNNNISINSVSEGFSNVAAAGTTTVLTVASAPNYVVTGSGGQTYQLPDATTLASGFNYTFNNNQSSGTIVVKNNSSTTIATIQSGGFVDVSLLSNATAAGSWDVHNFAPSNVSWSTNTFDYAGSITSATWNGATVALNRGGTGQTTAQASMNALAAAVTSGQYLRGNGTNVVMSAIQAADVPTLNQNTTGSAGSVANALTIGTGLSGTSYNGSAAVTIANSGVTSIVAGTGISISGATGAVTVTNTASGASITDDTTTNATRYPLYSAATSGTASTVYTSSSKYTYNPSTGALTATSHVSSSDERLKTNWRGLATGFVSKLSFIKSGVFDRTDFATTEVGVSAQSLQALIPEAVVTDEKGYLSVNYGGAALVAAIELAKEVKELRAEIAILKQKVNK